MKTAYAYKKTRKQIGKIRRSVCEPFGIAKYSRPALNNLDVRLEKYLNYKNGFFIEVGANDGFSYSNTYYFENLRGWRGILVEAIPELFEKCHKLRKKSKVFNCALVSSDYKDAHIKIKYANLMSLVEGAMSDAKKEAEHIEKGLRCQKIDKSYTIDVPVRTLTSILDECKIKEIDLFSLDVEGYELNVLKGLDFERYRPKYMCIEARFRKEIEEFICPYYEVIDELTEMDVLYKAKSFNMSRK